MLATRRAQRGERGQVTPALLAAVLGAFAIAVGLFTLARGSEQSARSDTAADAAALAAAKQWHTEALDTLLAAAAPTTEEIATVVEALTFFQPVGGHPQAASFAQANGGELLNYEWIPDNNPAAWVVQVEVEQRDDLTSNSSRNSRSTSRVEVKATGGLCNAGRLLGLQLRDGACANPVYLAVVCTPPTVATPNPLYVNCPQAADIALAFKTDRTFVDRSFLTGP